MKWRYKAALQGLFSRIPGGYHLNYLCQRLITRSLPSSEAKFESTLEEASAHFKAIQNHRTSPLSNSVFYEFGAGSDLTIPLSLFCLGVERQIITDIAPLARPFLVNDVIFKLFNRRAPLCRKPPKRVSSFGMFGDLERFFGIEYLAPCDGGRTPLLSDSIDCITSTNTLEHIPRTNIVKILKECHRILRQDGVMSFMIDYQDHYAYSDSSISVYNFLQFSEREWDSFNPALHYQNRMRHKDYLQLFEEASLVPVQVKIRAGMAADIEVIKRLPLSGVFGTEYDEAELSVRSAHFLLKKKV